MGPAVSCQQRQRRVGVMDLLLSQLAMADQVVNGTEISPKKEANKVTHRLAKKEANRVFINQLLRFKVSP